MKAVWTWVKDHGWIALLGLGVLACFLIGRRRSGDLLLDQIAVEENALIAAKRAKLLLAQHEHDATVTIIKQEHAEAVAQLDQAERDEATRLEADPVALSKFLVRAGKSQ